MVLKLVALVLPLGIDSFLVAASLGLAGLPERDRRRIPLLFAAFEGGMPLVGVLVGLPLGQLIGSEADYIAAAIIIAFGAYTLVAPESDEQGQGAALASARGLATVALGISISLDELAVGFSLGLLRLPLLVVCPVLAGQALVVSVLGLRLGGSLSARFRDVAERIAGTALILVGLALALAKLVA